MEYQSKLEIGQEVIFTPMARHREEFCINAEEHYGVVVAIKFTKAKVFYDVLCDYYGKVFEMVDSANAEAGKLEIGKMAIEDKGSLLLVDVNAIPETAIEDICKGFKDNHISIVKSEPTLEEAIKVLQKHLREDKSEGSYYYSWMCNLKMSMFDAISNHGIDNKSLLEGCEKGANSFLELLVSQ